MGKLTVNVALRTASDDDVAFARNLYFATMREIIERLFGWEQSQQEKKFARFFKLDEVRIITADGRDVGWIQEQISEKSINLGSLLCRAHDARPGHWHKSFANASGTSRQRIKNYDVSSCEDQLGTPLLRKAWVPNHP